MLHTTLTVHAPQPLSEPESQPEPQAVLPNLIVTLTQGAFFTILPAHDAGSSFDSAVVPEWYSGNIYAMERAPPKAVRFPASPSARGSTTYDVFVSGDYEVPPVQQRRVLPVPALTPSPARSRSGYSATPPRAATRPRRSTSR